MALAFRGGHLTRAGMDGRITGIDHAGVLACLPTHLDRDIVVALLAPCEAGLIAGLPES